MPAVQQVHRLLPLALAVMQVCQPVVRPRAPRREFEVNLREGEGPVEISGLFEVAGTAEKQMFASFRIVGSERRRKMPRRGRRGPFQIGQLQAVEIPFTLLKEVAGLLFLGKGACEQGRSILPSRAMN